MNPIDKIVTEWAFRCKKGYPDMNNPEDMKILKEIYSEYGIVMEEEKDEPQEQDISFEDLQQLLAARKGELNQQQINKLFKSISKTGKGYTSSIISILEKKGLGKQQALVVAGYADKNNFEDKLLRSIENPENKFSKLSVRGNLISQLFQITKIGENYIKDLIDFTVGAGQKSVGKGELALISLLYDTLSPKKGDVQTTSGDLIELKFGGAILVDPKHISRGINADSIIQQIIKILDIKEENQGLITSGNNVSWVIRLLRYTKDSEEIQKVLEVFYKGNVKLPVNKNSTPETVQYEIARQLAKDYINHTPQELMMIGDSYNYIILRTLEEAVANIGPDKPIRLKSNLSDLSPRLVFVE